MLEPRRKRFVTALRPLERPLICNHRVRNNITYSVTTRPMPNLAKATHCNVCALKEGMFWIFLSGNRINSHTRPSRENDYSLHMSVYDKPERKIVLLFSIIRVTFSQNRTNWTILSRMRSKYRNVEASHLVDPIMCPLVSPRRLITHRKCNKSNNRDLWV